MTVTSVEDASALPSVRPSLIATIEESILFSSTIKKRKGIFGAKKFLLWLTTKPRLVYLDPGSWREIDEISWNSDKPAIVTKKNKDTFHITGVKEYTLEILKLTMV